MNKKEARITESNGEKLQLLVECTSSTNTWTIL